MMFRLSQAIIRSLPPILMNQSNILELTFSEGDFTSLPPEPQQGNIEYKLKLVNPSSHRLEHLVTQMKWRLREGQG